MKKKHRYQGTNTWPMSRIWEEDHAVKKFLSYVLEKKTIRIYTTTYLNPGYA